MLKMDVKQICAAGMAALYGLFSIGCYTKEPVDRSISHPAPEELRITIQKSKDGKVVSAVLDGPHHDCYGMVRETSVINPDSIDSFCEGSDPVECLARIVNSSGSVQVDVIPEQPRIDGPETLKVGEVGHYSYVEDGKTPSIEDGAFPRGIWQVFSPYATWRNDGDGKQTTAAVSFNKPGEYSLRCKLGGLFGVFKQIKVVP